MKIQELLAQYLYKEKSLTLPGLGRFELDPSVILTDTKEQVWPEGAITFTMDRQAQLPDELLTFLVQQSGKMKPLALSDLESYISSGMQLINIGKPFLIKGIGSLSKNQTAQLQFEQGNPVLEKIDSISTDHVRDRTVLAEGETEIDFSHEERKSSKKPILIFGLIVALALVGWAVWLALPKKQATPTVEENTEQTTAADTPVMQQPDTSAVVKDTVQAVAPATTVVDTTSFKLVVETVSSKAKADARLAFHQSRNRELSLNVKDSSTYQLILLVQKPLSDSSKVKDSLRNWYGIKAQVIKPGN
ncbi:hypothetical protein IQ13_3968 [Lacibacter cauensis]|uniref:CCDC81-like prokaryotic HU domain-containing protein n=1 Tax=Lacibacter cauensis TaxID=510947 RepID=A0A562SCE0_9BACT|nr:hypothetical protein [Lacibacter cauensis]TWI78286.1 hypothetical protein IQ13_3968 [Lacibacter cauensis]